MKIICAVFLLTFLNYSNAYIAVVVEYHPQTDNISPYATLEENSNQYLYQIEKAKTVGEADIIIFPEYGLTGLQEDPQDYAIPIPTVGTLYSAFNDSVLTKLSKAALEYQIYVVINLLESELNEENNETLYYNTNVVFNPQGVIVAKYRKINLYDEPRLTPGSEIVTFTTNFTTFGLITCSDILFYNPAQVLVDQGVTDVIFPNAWTTVVPLFAALEVQLGYAVANRINLLSANLNNPTLGRGGSSIINREGTVLRRILTDSNATSLISAEVVLTPNPFIENVIRGFGDLDETRFVLPNYANFTAFDSASYNFQLLESQIQEYNICHADFCCTFNITSNQNETNEIYRVTAFNGPTLYDTSSINIKFCALVACLSDDIATCGIRPTSEFTTTFREVSIVGLWPTEPEVFYRPLGLSGNLDVIYGTTYLSEVTNETTSISFNFTTATPNVLLFGLYVGGASGVTTWCALVLGLFMILRVF